MAGVACAVPPALAPDGPSSTASSRSAKLIPSISSVTALDNCLLIRLVLSPDMTAALLPPGKLGGAPLSLCMILLPTVSTEEVESRRLRAAEPEEMTLRVGEDVPTVAAVEPARLDVADAANAERNAANPGPNESGSCFR